jgi:hypothetical protein
MTKLAHWGLCVVLPFIALSPALAQTSKKQPAATDCKASVSAAGPARPGERLARRAGETAWRAEVKSQFGEQYQELKYAKSLAYRCSAASIGLRRCTVSGIPCRVPTEGTPPPEPKKEPTKKKKK